MNHVLQPLAVILKENHSLKTLSFKNMGLEHLPVDLSAFPNLEYLDLSGNKFNTLPEQILKLKKLKGVNLSRNKKMNWSKGLMVLAECKKIEKLDLSNNALLSLPAEVYHFDNLKQLVLDGNNFNPLDDRNSMNLPDALECLSFVGCELPTVSNRTKGLKHIKKMYTSIFDFEILQQLHYLLPSATFLLR